MGLFSRQESSNFEDLADSLEANEVILTLTGIVNVESGDISVRASRVSPKNGMHTGHFEECEKCDSVEFGQTFFVRCEACGKSEGNYFWIRSGDGDGVYLVFELLKREPASGDILTLGFVVLFDSGYEYSKELVEETIKSAAPSYQYSLLEEFYELEAFEITEFALSENHALYISEKNALADTPDAIKHVFFDEQATSVRFLAFAEEVGEQDEPASDVNPKPRLLVALDSRLPIAKSFKATMQRPEGEAAFMDWEMTGTSSSHLEPMHAVATWYNYQFNAAIGLQNYAASWLLQGAVHGDQDSLEALANYDLSDLEWVATWLSQRQQWTAEKYVQTNGKLPFKVKAKHVPTAVEGPDWRSFKTFWSDADITISPAIAGFVDIEGGAIAVAGKWFPTCEICNGEGKCETCKRNPAESIAIRSGVGDGLYCVHELFFDNQAMGALVVFDSGEYVGPIIEMIQQAHDEVFEDRSIEQELYEGLDAFIYRYLENASNTGLFEIAQITASAHPVLGNELSPRGTLIFGEAGEGTNSNRSLVALNHIPPGQYRVFVFGHRDYENSNCLVPKFLMVLHETIANTIGLRKGFAESLDLSRETTLWNKATVFARIGDPLAPTAIVNNVCYNDIRGSSDLIGSDLAYEYRMESLSWLLLLSSIEDETELRQEAIRALEPYKDKLRAIHLLRGQTDRDLYAALTATE